MEEISYQIINESQKTIESVKEKTRVIISKEAYANNEESSRS